MRNSLATEGLGYANRLWRGGITGVRSTGIDPGQGGLEHENNLSIK